MLRPLLGQLGSRHHLPVAEVRSAAGLRGKLVGFFLSVTVLTSGLVVLFALSPAAADCRPCVASVALALALSLALVLLIVRDVVTPIQALEARSEEMARGELARPVPPSGEADEIGRLTFAFEEMRRALRDKLRSTESINIDLEREVRRRTEALEQRNAELREALEKLRRAQDDLVRSEKLASMGRLVAGIAHEINNPVNAVINTSARSRRAFAELATRRTARRPPPARDGAARCWRVVQRGAQPAPRPSCRRCTTIRAATTSSLARSTWPAASTTRWICCATACRTCSVEKEVDPALRVRGLRRSDRPGADEPGHQRRPGDRRARRGRRSRCDVAARRRRASR